MAWQWSSPAAGISGIDAMLLLNESRHVERIIRTRIDSE
jgi:hypothetical protein